MLAKVFSSAVLGIDAYRVEVEPVPGGAFLSGFSNIEPEKTTIGDTFKRDGRFAVDYAEVMGQEHVKRALEIAAAGGHNLLLL